MQRAASALMHNRQLPDRSSCGINGTCSAMTCNKSSFSDQHSAQDTELAYSSCDFQKPRGLVLCRLLPLKTTRIRVRCDWAVNSKHASKHASSWFFHMF